MGSMYAAVLLIGIKNANAVQPAVAVERTVFYRERAAGMYSALPYAFAQASIPYSKNLSFIWLLQYPPKKSKGQEADFTTQRCYLKDITKQLILCLFSSFRRLLERFKIIPFICFIMCKLFTCVLWFFFLLSNLHLLLQVTIELPYILVQAVVYGIIIYAMIGFEWTVAKVFWYLFFMYFTFLYFTFYGMMAVAVTPNQHISSIVSTAFYSIWNLFSGFIVPRPVSFGFLSFIVYLNSLNNILVPVIWIFFLFSSL